MNKKETKNVKININLITILKKLSADSGKPIYKYVEEAIEQYLEDKKRDK